ncbi:MAG: transglycosylase SLT domain-containing protein [Rhodospirillaceae bacterium]
MIRFHGARLAWLACAAALVAAVPASAGMETASLPPQPVLESDAVLPSVLSAADLAAYRRVFELQQTGKWGPADQELKRVEDKRLLGHVLAQRYLAKGYTTRYEQLADWLGRYADHPDAITIYKLALKRKPKHAKAPPSPTGAQVIEAAAGAPLTRDDPGQTAVDSDFAAEQQDLEEAASADMAEDASDASPTGRTKDALTLAEGSAGRAPKKLTTAQWTAGLAAWRQGQMDKAADNFEAVAATLSTSTWSRAAGAFWASRAHLAARRPEQASAWLKVAAKYPRTFYGLLAQRALGVPLQIDWTTPALTDAGIDGLMANPGGARALALIQLGDRVRAEQELKLLRAEDATAARSLMAVALKGEMPALAMAFGRRIEKLDGQRYEAALYPIPGWVPTQGYIVDRALVFALMRQESGFNVTAKSRAGAHGLMQLMPATASLIAQDRTLKGSDKHKLFDPELNIDLAQKYVSHLLDQSHVNGDLFNLLAAYNAGPGNLMKWQKKVSYGDDPLMFIEALPSRETRAFIQHVLASYWIYRAQLGQETQSLDLIAAGQWPLYAALDGEAPIRNAGN